MTDTEGYLEVDGGRVWYRSVGEGGTPLLCLHGGPGFTHYYLEPLEALADRLEVIFYDQLGCGRSDRPADPALWTVARFVEELAQVRAALGLTRLHLFGSSWGGMLAMQYVLDRRPELDSLILCGSPASMTRWARDCACAGSAQPGAGTPGHPGARGRRVHRLPRVPGRHPRLLPGARLPREPLAGQPGALVRRGGLRRVQHDERAQRVHGDRDAEDLGCDGPAGRNRVLALLVGGRHDECTPGHLAEMHARIPGSQLAIIEDASHLCFTEQPTVFTSLVNTFLDRQEAARPAAAGA